MRWIGIVFLGAVALAAGKPLITIPKFGGAFTWIKVGPMPAATVKALSHAKSFEVDMTFPKPVKLKKDKNGNTWFSVLIADQGSDWKWHQTNAPGVLPVSGGVIKAGKYAVQVSVKGIPASVLSAPQQSATVGAGCSGLSAPIPFSIDAIKAR